MVHGGLLWEVVANSKKGTENIRMHQLFSEGDAKQPIKPNRMDDCISHQICLFNGFYFPEARQTGVLLKIVFVSVHKINSPYKEARGSPETSHLSSLEYHVSEVGTLRTTLRQKAFSTCDKASDLIGWVDLLSDCLIGSRRTWWVGLLVTKMQHR